MTSYLEVLFKTWREGIKFVKVEIDKSKESDGGGIKREKGNEKSKCRDPI